jgi:hypothetical protein
MLLQVFSDLDLFLYPVGQRLSRCLFGGTVRSFSLILLQQAVGSCLGLSKGTEDQRPVTTKPAGRQPSRRMRLVAVGRATG